jgi:transposase InsO family protein
MKVSMLPAEAPPASNGGPKPKKPQPTPWSGASNSTPTLKTRAARFYNPHRRHSALGYLSPAHYERIHREAARAA